MRDGRSERWLPWLLLGAALLAWEIGAALRWVDPLFWPAPSTILRTLVEETASGALASDLTATLGRLLAGLAIGGGAGMAIGLWMGWSPRVHRFLDPVVAMLHPIPKIALLPLVMLVLGIGESSQVATIALSSFFPMLINTLAGVQQIAPVHWEVARSYGVRGRHLWTHLLVPASLPMALTGLRLAWNTALIVTISVELLAAQTGLGAQIWLAWQTMRLRHLYAALLVIALLGYGFNVAFARLSARLTPWLERGRIAA